MDNKESIEKLPEFKNLAERLDYFLILKKKEKEPMTSIAYNKTQVENAANLSMFMVNFSRIIASQIQDPDSTSMLDLKAHFQGLFYLEQVLKIDPKIQEVISFDKLQKTMANIGRVHQSQNQPILKDKTPLNHPTQNKENGGKDTKVIEAEEKGTAVIAFAKITKKSLRLVADCLKSVTRKAS